MVGWSESLTLLAPASFVPDAGPGALTSPESVSLAFLARVSSPFSSVVAGPEPPALERTNRQPLTGWPTTEQRTYVAQYVCT